MNDDDERARAEEREYLTAIALGCIAWLNVAIILFALVRAR